MDPEVVEPQSDQAIEDKLAAAFERQEQAGKTPAEEKPSPEAQHEPEDEPTEEVTAQAEETEQTEESPDAGFEEVEFEGEVFRVPQKIKDGLLRQKDYTQKTQATAEEKRILAEERAAFQAQAAFQQQHFGKAVEAYTLQQQIQQFDKVDWSKLADENPAEAIKLHAQYTQLQSKFAGVKEEMQGLNGQFQQQMQETRQKAQAQCLQELKKDFPDLASAEKGQALLRQWNETGLSFGFTSQELAQIADPRMIRVLHAATQFKKLQGAKPLVEKKVSTAKPVQVQASRTGPSNQQTSQISELRARLAKTGKSSDAEALLAARFAKARI